MKKIYKKKQPLSFVCSKITSSAPAPSSSQLHELQETVKDNLWPHLSYATTFIVFINLGESFLVFEILFSTVLILAALTPAKNSKKVSEKSNFFTSLILKVKNEYISKQFHWFFKSILSK